MFCDYELNMKCSIANVVYIISVLWIDVIPVLCFLTMDCFFIYRKILLM